jgi:predicted enzyme related to lactoylglutathione lyase
MGKPVHWKLLSKDPAKLSEFYGKIFACKIRHSAEMNYHLVETGGSSRINGGIMRPFR